MSFVFFTVNEKLFYALPQDIVIFVFPTAIAVILPISFTKLDTFLDPPSPDPSTTAAHYPSLLIVIVSVLDLDWR